MSIESLRRRLVRLHTTKYDYRIGLADRLAAARAARQARRAKRVTQGLPADLTTEERIADLQARLAAESIDGAGLEYAGASEIGLRLYMANQRVLKLYLSQIS